MTTVTRIEEALRRASDPGQVEAIATRVPRDQILGVRMKHTFDLARAHRDLPLTDVRRLIRSHWYEMRMVGVSVLDARARRFDPATAERTDLYEVYLSEHRGINTWDLVDRAAPRVLGEYLLDRSRAPLHRLARSTDRWERRSAVVASFWIIRHGDPADPVEILEALADDPEPFVQTALGTAVRELRRAHGAAAAAFERSHALSSVARRAARAGRS